MERARPKLIRATPDNGVFSELMDEWERQLSQDDDAPRDYHDVMLRHAEKIAGERPQHPHYGIFVLASDRDSGSRTFDGLAHINHAFPNTSRPVTRVVWNVIAPRYDFEDFDPGTLARIKGAFIIEALALCNGAMRSSELKLYLGNSIDREYAVVAATIMGEDYPQHGFHVRGGWLHILLDGQNEQ